MVRAPRFDAAWQRRRKFARAWRRGRGWLLSGLLIGAAWWLTSGPGWGLGETLRSQFGIGADWSEGNARFAICGERSARACVIDGDTVVIGDRRIRLTGFDAPELDGECEAERLLARQSREALKEWLNRGAWQMDGGDEPPRDLYGRELRAVRRVSGQQVEWLDEAMTQRGLARRDRSDAGWCG